MSAGKKIASAAIPHRTQSGFWQWARNKLLAVYRRDITPPAGLSEDGKSHYAYQHRFPSTQSARPGSAELPSIPGGVSHKLEDNYYYTRDGRHEVKPPDVVYDSTTDQGKKLIEGVQAHPLARTEAAQLNVGPAENFGLIPPTPGFGHTWKRETSHELAAQQANKDMRYYEKFDRFRANH